MEQFAKRQPKTAAAIITAVFGLVADTFVGAPSIFQVLGDAAVLETA